VNIKQIQRLIEAHKEIAKAESKEWAELVRWHNGEFFGGETEGGNTDALMHTNYLFAAADSISAALIPHNPRAHCRPKHPQDTDAARRAERLLTSDFKASRIDEISRLSIRRTILKGRSMAKTVWNPDTKQPEARDIEPVRLWWDFDVPLEESEYVIEVTTLKEHELQKRLKRSKAADGSRPSATYSKKGLVESSGDQFPRWLMELPDHDTTSKWASVKDIFQWYLIYEVWFPQQGEVVHLMEGASDFLFKGKTPYGMVNNPYVMLAFLDNLEDHRGLSDAKLIRNLQARINELQQIQLEHVHRTIPGVMYDERAIGDADIEKLEDVEPGEYKGLSPTEGRSIQDSFAPTPTPTLSPDFYQALRKAEEDLQFVIGLPDWIRGQVNNVETATEMALTENSIRNRFTLRQSRIRRWHEAIAERFLMLRQELMEDPVDIGGFTPSDVPVPATPQDVAAVFNMEVVAYDPMDWNKAVRRESMMQVRGMWMGAPHIDIVKIDREIANLMEIDPTVVVDGPQQPGQVAAAAGADPMALAAGAAPEEILAGGGPMPPGPMPPPMPGA